MRKINIDFNQVNLGSSSLTDTIVDYEIIYYEDGQPDVKGNLIDEIMIIFESGHRMTVDESLLDIIKEAKKHKLIVDVDYRMTIRKPYKEGKNNEKQR